MTTKKLNGSLGNDFLRSKLGTPITFGIALESLRDLYQQSQTAFAKKLGISRAYLCDVEKGRRFVSPGKAALFAKLIGHPPEYFVQLAIDDMLRAEGLKLKVQVNAA